MNSPALVLCTHNPRRDYLERTLRSVANCVIPAEWGMAPRLILVDNASEPALQEEDWKPFYPHLKMVKEPRVGLTVARLRGIRTAVEADWLLFLDDDNELAPDYLTAACAIRHRDLGLGCFGGSQLPQFEVAPVPAAHPFLPALALRTIERASWSSNYDFDTVPYGAGMWVRRDVAEAFCQASENDNRRFRLGRTGANLAGCEDLDLAFTACDLGYACGLFPELKLTHLIPARRLSLPYLRQLNFASGYSDILLRSIRFPEKLGWVFGIRKLLEYLAQPLLPRDPARPRKNAFRRGQLRALFDLWRGSRK